MLHLVDDLHSDCTIEPFLRERYKTTDMGRKNNLILTEIRKLTTGKSIFPSNEARLNMLCGLHSICNTKSKNNMVT